MATKSKAKASGKTAAGKKTTGKKVVEQLNETGQRKSDRRKNSGPVANDRRKVSRRRLIDPTTCERDYSQDEIEFMQSMDEYKRKSGRMFPTCSEILEVIREMGYRRLSEEQLKAEQLVETTDENFVLDCEEDVREADMEEEFTV